MANSQMAKEKRKQDEFNRMFFAFDLLLLLWGLEVEQKLERLWRTNNVGPTAVD